MFIADVATFPFSSRANGKLILMDNRNETLEMTINDLQYTESGLIIVKNILVLKI